MLKKLSTIFKPETYFTPAEALASHIFKTNNMFEISIDFLKEHEHAAIYLITRMLGVDIRSIFSTQTTNQLLISNGNGNNRKFIHLTTGEDLTPGEKVFREAVIQQGVDEFTTHMSVNREPEFSSQLFFYPFEAENGSEVQCWRVIAIDEE
jgi:hypothetical protein